MLLCSWDFPGKNTGLGCHFFLQGFSQPRDRARISKTTGIFFITKPPGKPKVRGRGSKSLSAVHPGEGGQKPKKGGNQL